MSYYSELGTLMRDEQTFTCQACLADKPLSELSPRDAHYCVFCQAIIAEEYRAAAERAGRANQYKPKPLQNQREPEEMDALRELPIADPKTKMSTVNAKPLTEDNFRPRGRPKQYRKRELPADLIEQLHSHGMGNKAIATELKTAQGVVVSYKTIQRVLSGKRTSKQ